ncbi:MAG TPA: TonB family protein [Blastocatellia bacterium]|nr:TonB family protein [Blastocatellia bacterium]
MEKQALTTVQQVSVNRLDAALPRSPFADWLRRQVGSQAGIVWQLSECGAPSGAESQSDQDLKACVEANALLPDGRKVIVMVTVGTFKQGITGDPEFNFALIEEQGELSPIPQLHDLQTRLHPDSLPISAPKSWMPAATAAPVNHQILFQPPTRLPKTGEGGLSEDAAGDDPPPPPPTQEAASQPAPAPPPLRADSSPAAAGGVVQGSARTKAQPLYPANARRVSAEGLVEVRVVISDTGIVTEARAISGHPLLREAAMEAARKWIFNPTTFNGVPVKTQVILSFIFTAP